MGFSEFKKTGLSEQKECGKIMFRKFNYRILLGAFILLLALVVVSKIIESRKGDSSFRTDLLAFDTSKVSSISITQGIDFNKSVNLEKGTKGWIVSQAGKTYKADGSVIQSLMTELAGTRIERIASKTKDKWKEFEVTDSLAIKVQIRQGSKYLLDLLIGKFNWQPSDNPYNRQGTISSFIRLADEPEVYAINGFLRMSFGSDPAAYRNKKIVEIDKEKLNQLNFSYKDSSFRVEKTNGKWLVDGTPADSARTIEFLDNFMRISGSDFHEPVEGSVKPLFTLHAEIAGGLPLVINAFPGDSAHFFIVNSSQNPESFFSVKQEITNRIFKGKSFFITK
jgi:hypothetical protein